MSPGRITQYAGLSFNSSTGVFSAPKVSTALRLPVSTKTTTYQIVATDYMICGNTTSAGFTVTLPSSPSTGDSYCIKQVAAVNTLTVSGNGKNIDGAASVGITIQYMAITVVYNGTEWSIA